MDVSSEDQVVWRDDIVEVIFVDVRKWSCIDGALDFNQYGLDFFVCQVRETKNLPE